MRHVMIVQRRLPEYRLAFFDSLRERLSQEGLVLHLWHGRPTAAEMSQDNEGHLGWAVERPCRYLSGGRGRAPGLVWISLPAGELSDMALAVLPHENRMLSNYPLVGMRGGGRPVVALWGHGGNFQSRSGGTAADRLRGWIARRAGWYFGYTGLSVERVVAAGFPRERTTCLNNTIDAGELEGWRAQVTDGETEALRRELGLRGRTVAVALGSLSEIRRLPFLWQAADRLRAATDGFELVIVGDGPMREEATAFAADRPWVHWVGARHGRDKVLHALLGRVLLNPGAVGLNIIDSFALGIPLVTTDCGLHGPEIAYLRSDENGVMTADTLDAFTQAALRLLTDDALRGRLVAGCAAAAGVYTLKAMVDNFTDGILRALTLHP